MINLKRKIKLLLIILLCAQIRIFAKNYVINGYVKDSETGEALIGANVSLANRSKGVSANNYGYYSLSVEEGGQDVVCSFVGYEPVIKKIMVGEDVRFDIHLKPQSEMLDAVMVSAEAVDHNVVSVEMGTQTLKMKEVKLVPVLFGENDILKTIQLMPGVKGGGEGSTGFFVRGGGADQNLVLLDDAPIYNASHMMGFFSIFNGDAIKDVKLYKGSMPAEYGGRLSSVLDVRMKDGNNQKLSINGGIGTISSRATIEGPFANGKGSVLLSGRRTYADVFLLFSKQEAFRKTKLHFYDLNLKANYSINDNNRIFLSGYMGEDFFNFKEMFGSDWGNKTATLRWSHIVTPRLFFNSTAVYSNFITKLEMDTEIGSGKITSGIEDLNLIEDFQYFLNQNNTLKFGISAIHHTFKPGKVTTNLISNDGLLKSDNKYSLETGLFISNTQTIAGGLLNLQYGVRLSNFAILGGTNYTYEDHQKVDSTVYSRYEVAKNYFALEPRISATLKTGLTSSVKASYSRNQQYAHLIQSSTIGAMPIDYWFQSSSNIGPQMCDQYSVGYFRNFANNSYESSVEVYYKDMQHQLDYENGANVITTVNLESYLLSGQARSYGVEFLLKKNVGKLTGWLSYTWSKTEKQFDKLNEGNWFPARYDRTHDVSVVAMYDLSERWKLSATWVYATGDAVTYPVGKYTIDDIPIAYYTERNGSRMPDTHRMDLGVTFVAKKTDKFESSWNFSIYNAYNHKNAYMIYFEAPDPECPDILEARKVTLFPILPSVTWNFKF